MVEPPEPRSPLGACAYRDAPDDARLSHQVHEGVLDSDQDVSGDPVAAALLDVGAGGVRVVASRRRRAGRHGAVAHGAGAGAGLWREQSPPIRKRWALFSEACPAAASYLVGHGGGRGMVAGWGVRVLVADGRGRHLVVALGAGAGLVGALRGRRRVRRILLRVVPEQTRQTLARLRPRLCGVRARHSHSRRARRLRVVLGVDLWRGGFWVAGGLRVGGPAVALRRRGGLVVVAEVVLLLVSGHKRSKCFTATRQHAPSVSYLEGVLGLLGSQAPL